MNISLNIAGTHCLIQINNKRWHKFFKEKYKEFLIEGKSNPNFKLKIFVANRKSKISHTFNEKSASYTLFFPDNLKRFKRFNTYFKLFFSNSLLLQKKGFLLHASALEINNTGIIFCGNQRQGKSTIIKMFPEYKPLNDDAAIIKKHNKEFVIYSSPFYEKNKIEKRNVFFPINRIFLIKKARKNNIYKLRKKEKIQGFISNVYIEGESKKIRHKIFTNLFSLCYTVAESVPIDKLTFKKDKSVIRLILKEIKKK